MDQSIEALKSILAPVLSRFPEISAVYLFGSHADGTADVRSDFDFGALCQRETAENRCVEILGQCAAEISKVLKSDAIDFVVLNLTSSIELKFAITFDGVLIYSAPSCSSAMLEEYERHIRHEYEDHMSALRRHGLTRG